MNELQARNQESFSKGESPKYHPLPNREVNSDSSNDSTGESDDDKAKETSQPDQNNNDVKITKKVFITMLVIAIILDLAGFLLNLIFLIGNIASIILIWLPGTILFFIIYLKLGVKFSGKNSFKIAGCSIVELVPVLNALPAFTLNVVLTLGPMVAKDIVKDMPGGEGFVNKVQQAMSGTKRE